MTDSTDDVDWYDGYIETPRRRKTKPLKRKGGCVIIKWECFHDESYYGLWAVRPVGENRWGHCFHVQTRQEAEGLRDLLNKLSAKNAELSGGTPSAEAGCSALHGRIAELENGLRQIAVWNQSDQDDRETCALQWRGCVAIARELLKPNAHLSGGEAVRSK